MHTITIHNTAYPIPSRWDELSADQLRHMAWLLSRAIDGLATSKLLFYILTSALPLTKRLRLQYFYLIQATTDERGDLLLLVDSFRENRQFTTQLFPKLRWRFVLLHGPDSGLANCSFYEFIKAEQYFLLHLYHQSSPFRGSGGSESNYLDLLISTLYRPLRKAYDPNEDSDPRTRLTDSGTKARLLMIEQLDLKTKLAILMWFDGCRQFLVSKFPLLFAKPTVKEEASLRAAPRKPSSPRSQAAWMKLISELAGSMNQYKEIGDTNLIIAFMDISHRIQKNIDAKKHAAANAKPKRNR